MVKGMRQILDGRYGNKLVDCFSGLDQKYHNGYIHNKSIPLILSGEIANPYQYYIEHRHSDLIQQQEEALPVLAAGLWIDKRSIYQQANAAQLKTELLVFLKADDLHIRLKVFSALEGMLPLNRAEDLSCYIEACVKYINDFHQILPSWNWLLWDVLTKDFKIETQARISEEALRWICTRTRSKMPVAFEFADTFTYNVCSLLDDNTFRLVPSENSLDEAIEYITRRLEAIVGQPQ